MIATAFHRNTLTNSEGGTNDEEFRNAAVVDRVNTTFAVWMGTTMACAQCHTHKYDPITQEEYFKVFAIFNNTADMDQRDESPLLSVYTPDQRRQRAAFEEELAQLKGVTNQETPELVASQKKWESEFPVSLAWQNITPTEVISQAGSNVVITDEYVDVVGGPDTDTYTVNLPLPAGPLRPLQLETLTNDALPHHGPGHGGGNFVITSVRGTISPPEDSTIIGRYVRIEIPGPQKILSLAEVQLFQGTENIAPKGEASQSSTGFAGPANLAIDGNTDGQYMIAKSTTHTETFR